MGVQVQEFENGLVLLGEPIRSLESAAFTFLLPSGAAHDPDQRRGLAALTCDMVQRGCGERDSRQFIEDLENLGVDGGESVSVAHTNFGAAMLADNLAAALAIYAEMLRDPHLPAEQLEASRQVAIQELRAVEDEPGQKAMQELRRHVYGDPWGRPGCGDLVGLEAATIDDVQKQFANCYQPRGTILAVAGHFDWQQLCDTVANLFGDWQVAGAADPPTGGEPTAGGHIEHDSNQTQIGIAYPCVPYRDPDYYQAWGGVGILSGGMSSRLFTEVREKRGLCYSVYASCHSLRDRGSVLCYAGTSAERAQETLDVTLAELQRLAEGIEPVELARLKARMKSSLIMQQESSTARSSAIARDWYHLGDVRTLEVVGKIIDDLSCESINAYLAAHPPSDFTVVTLGPNPLEVSLGTA